MIGFEYRVQNRFYICVFCIPIMTDGRRHSVDVPISKTIVALRRVRSLRDPSTNSMNRFSTSSDNVHWETGSSNGISLQFLGGGSVDYALPSKKLGTCDTEDLDLPSNFRNDELVLCENSVWGETDGISVRMEKGNQLDYSFANQAMERYCKDQNDKKFELACLGASDDNLVYEDSSHDRTVAQLPVERVVNTGSGKKYQHQRNVRSSGPVSEIASCADSPYLSKSDALSSYDESLYAKEEVDVADGNHPGCGLRCWWSRTPTSRESNLSSDVDDCPLLSGTVDETTPRPRSWKNIYNDVTQCTETHRTLSQKFKPKSFNELAGQNIVARSLSEAICKGRIASFYLFHGPRGTGKTSASRIFAAALNCLSPEGQKPCGLCRECVFSFSGRSRNVKEVDPVRINRTDRVKSLVKNAMAPPVSSRYKVFIVDECHLLQEETWATILNNLGDFSQYVIFVMITPELDKLPRTALSRSQKYHFPKIKDADITVKLSKICAEEALDFEKGALDFIASKSNGSLRDSEMMLDQLSLLGRKISLSLAYEFVGIVSDDELLSLLDLAFSSDTSNTVIRARELMRSRIDPMQLVSQLANLIMDILAGKCREGSSEFGRKFFERYASEADLPKLNHALTILSESEKQLRVSKNQTTWLTVALLQLSSGEFSSSDANDLNLCFSKPIDSVADCCRSSNGKSPKNLLSPSAVNKLSKVEIQEDYRGTLENIWRRTAESCQSNALKKFLKKKGKLSSLSVNQGVAVADLEFHHRDHVSKAEKSWKLIASTLQSILGCNVEIRINAVARDSVSKYTKVKNKLFSCVRKTRRNSLSPTVHGTELDYSSYNSKPTMDNITFEASSSCCGPDMSHNCRQSTEMVTSYRNSEGNVLVTGVMLPNRQTHDDSFVRYAGDSSLTEKGSNNGYRYLSIQGPEIQSNCLCRSPRHPEISSSDNSQLICLSIQAQNNLALSIPKRSSFLENTCSADSYAFCSCDSNNPRAQGIGINNNI